MIYFSQPIGGYKMLQFTQGEIARIYGYIWEDTNDGQKAYLRAKLNVLNKGNMKAFYGALDLENQKSFRAVAKAKLTWLYDDREEV